MVAVAGASSYNSIALFTLSSILHIQYQNKIFFFFNFTLEEEKKESQIKKRYENCTKSEMESSSTSFSLSKKRKIIDSKQLQELELTSPDIKPITVSTSTYSGRVLIAGEMCSSLSSGDSSASRSCSNESCAIVKASLRFVDLKAKNFETEISTNINIKKFSKETTPAIELIGDSEETGSQDRETSPSPEKSPSQAEIDDFFSVAEKYERVRFAEKQVYNYDIVKDVPLDGGYQWIRLKQ